MMIINHSRDRQILLILALTVFLLVLRVGLWTPMHADDYFYLRKGISLDATVAHYFNWSGRLVADFIASALLSLGNHSFASALNTAALVALITVIWWVPRFGERAHSGYRSLTFVLLFFGYWLGNAALGQTTFWIVGSANYLWTNILQCLFVGFFLREAQLPAANSSPRTVLITLLALAAGCTNENTSATTLALAGAYAAVLTYRRRGNGRLWLYLAAFAIGAAVLVLAPGNTKRLVFFPEWTTLTFAQQLEQHFVHRISTAMGRIWPSIALLLVLVTLRPELSKSTRWHVAIFAAAAFLSLVVFFMSPAMPRRSLNGTLVYVLVASSFVLAGWNGQSSVTRHGLRAVAAIFGMCFIVSYGLIARSYQDVWRQAAEREQLILSAIATGETKIVVPEFQFGRLLRPKSDELVSFFPSEDVALHYGTSASIVQHE